MVLHTDTQFSIVLRYFLKKRGLLKSYLWNVHTNSNGSTQESKKYREYSFSTFDSQILLLLSTLLVFCHFVVVFVSMYISSSDNWKRRKTETIVDSMSLVEQNFYSISSIFILILMFQTGVDQERCHTNKRVNSRLCKNSHIKRKSREKISYKTRTLSEKENKISHSFSTRVKTRKSEIKI